MQADYTMWLLDKEAATAEAQDIKEAEEAVGYSE